MYIQPLPTIRLLHLIRFAGEINPCSLFLQAPSEADWVAGSYTYIWQKDEGSGTYSNADGPDAIDQPSYQAPGLDVTTHFARIARSGVCADTSASTHRDRFGNHSQEMILHPSIPSVTIPQPDQIGGADSGSRRSCRQTVSVGKCFC